MLTAAYNGGVQPTVQPDFGGQRSIKTRKIIKKKLKKKHRKFTSPQPMPDNGPHESPPEDRMLKRHTDDPDGSPPTPPKKPRLRILLPKPRAEAETATGPMDTGDDRE